MNMPVFCCWLIICACFDLCFASWKNPSSRSGVGQDVRKCFSDIEKENDITHLLLETSSPEDILIFCRRMSKLKKCIAENEHQMSVSENTECLRKTRGITIFYLNVCPPGSNITEKYKENALCLGRIEKQILSCASELPQVSYLRIQDDPKRCCALKRHRICITEAVFLYCGKEAAEVVEQILLRYFGAQLEQCGKHHIQTCSSPESDDHWLDGRREDIDTNHHHESEIWDLEERRRRKHKSSSNSSKAAVGTVLLCLIYILIIFVV
ncbi:uncharacterized protein TNIN_5831 [Trichonephila inaurata madagascariensis]|uniref:Uncharacterized protein n=1 Tax=Trichonephila inaurata madagascariensis TaxID=2747483 RepID=A0A8X6X062_9ARAC|nr:uncharacterized protein TNIN_5831 [Trichonephila inaurata madagascariensis]